MNSDELPKEFYERDSVRFWSPENPVGRDLVILPLVPGSGGTVVEYGFGSGSLLFELAKSFDKAIGFEVAPSLIDRAEQHRQRLGLSEDRVQFCEVPPDGSLNELATATVDLAVAVATLEHMFDPYSLLDEFYRVTKVGATLIASVPNYGYLKNRISLLFGALPRTGTDLPVSKWRDCGWDGGHLHTFTKSAFRVLLQETGWSVDQWHGWGRYIPRLRAAAPGLLSGEIIAVCTKRT